MGGLLVSTDVPSGRRIWERQVAGEDTPYVAGDWMFVISVEQQLAAVHVADGRVAWITDLPRWEDAEKKSDTLTWYGPLLVADRLIVTGTLRGCSVDQPLHRGYSGPPAVVRRRSAAGPGRRRWHRAGDQQ